MNAFDAAFALVVGAEGGYTADPADPGGATNWGISQRAYPALDIATLTRADAQAIYLRDYWTPLACGLLPAPIALVVFDAAVNQGVGWAARALQQALGVAQDGEIGPVTLAAAHVADAVDLIAEFGWLRECRYRADPEFPRYGHGWIRRLLTMTSRAMTYSA